MAQNVAKKPFLKTYGFLICMIAGIVAGCIVGAVWPGATALEPIGTVFINMMFCVVVPMVFVSISSAIANMKSARRAGKVMGVTVLTFCVTAAVAAVIMYIVARVFPLVTGDYPTAEGEVGETLGVADMIINFFTKPDFTELFSRRAPGGTCLSALQEGGHGTVENPINNSKGCGGVLWHLLVCRDDPDQYGGRGGDRHFQGCV